MLSMLGNLGSSVAYRFARSLRETGAKCDLVFLVPEGSATKDLRRTAEDWGAVVYLIHTKEKPYSTINGNKDKLIRYWSALQVSSRI